MAEKKNSSKSKGDALKVVIIIGIFVVVALLITIIVLLLKGKEPEDTTPRNVVITPDNIEEVIQEMDARVEEKNPIGYYTVSMTYEWHFPNGNSVSPDALVRNQNYNTNPVYFDVFLKDDEENAIYESPVIPLGAELKDIALDTDLDAGTYDCIVVYHLIDEEQNTLSTLRVTATIIVEG